MTAERARERLQDERRQVAEQVEKLRAGLARSLEDEIEEDGSDSHLGDSATATFDRELDVTLEDTLADQLAQIDGAIERLDAGTFGTCIECGSPIAADRLEALPYVDRCIDCARAHP